MRYILQKKGQQISNILEGHQSIHIGGQWRSAADAAGNKELTLNEQHFYSQHHLLQALFFLHCWLLPVFMIVGIVRELCSVLDYSVSNYFMTHRISYAGPSDLLHIRSRHSLCVSCEIRWPLLTSISTLKE